MEYGLTCKDWDRPRVDKHGITRIKYAISEVNGIAEKAESIRKSGGDHYFGDRSIQKCYKRLDILLKTKLIDEKTLNDFLSGARSVLSWEGYKVLFYGYPIPYLCLAKYDYGFHAHVITSFEHGSQKAFCRFSPATDKLLLDAKNNRYVDGTRLSFLNSNEKKIKRWKVFSLLDHVGDLVLRQHYLFEKNNFLDIGKIAEKFGLSNVLRVLKFKVYADHLHYPAREGFYRFDWKDYKAAEKFAFENDIPSEVLKAEIKLVSGKFLRSLESMVREKIVTPFYNYTSKPSKAGGALATRSQKSVLMGALGGPSDFPEELRTIEKEAAVLFAHIQDMFLNGNYSGKKEHIFQTIDIADLESESRQRKLMAAVEIQENFERFFQGSGLEEKYEDMGKDVPNCPMPMDGIVSIDDRLRASVGAKIHSDFGSLVAKIPGHFFEYVPDFSLNESENQAYEKIYKLTGEMARNRIILEELIHSFHNLKEIFEGWLTFFECEYKFAGCGIDSVDKLLFPAFFFSDLRFKQMFADEEGWFKEGWLNIRKLLPKLHEHYKNGNWHDLKRLIRDIFEEFKKLSLRVTTGPSEEPEIVNPLYTISQDSNSPFASPKSYFSKKMVQTKYSLAPIQIVEAPPGNPRKYEFLVNKNQSHINKMKRLESRPMKPVARIKRFAKSGPIFDHLQLHKYQFSETINCSVTYLPQPVPGERELIVIVFDFSGSMGKERVAKAKDIAVIISEGLKRFDLMFYLYTTDQYFYELILIYNSQEKSAGQGGLASITAQDTEQGRGWNPDAAIMLTVKDILEKTSGKRRACVVHLGDHEYCNSLSKGELTNAQEEMEYVVQELTDAGHHYIAARVGTDADPYEYTDLPHQYIHFPEGRITEGKVKELYQILMNTFESDG